MFTCPRCGAVATAIRQDLEVALPGGAWRRQLITTGWMCDNDHFLAPREVLRPEEEHENAVWKSQSGREEP